MADAPRPSQRMGRISARTGKPVDPAPQKKPSKKSTGENVFHAADRTAEFYDHLQAHYRQSKRAPSEIEAQIKLVMLDGTVFDFGSAKVLNISPSGALLGNVKLPKNCYPVPPFKLEIVMKGGDYDGIGIEAAPIRFEHEHGGLGVKFLEIFVAV
jgi:hypothetical protein